MKHLFVSLFGDPSSVDNARIIRRATLLAEHRNDRRPMEVSFYDAASAKVWG